MTASDRELLTALVDHSVAPRILDIHLDGCEDDACTGCDPQHLAEKAEERAGAPDPLAYGPRGYRCGCGKHAHSNLVPCAAVGGESRG